MPMTLTLLRADVVLGVEGFADSMQAAAWTKVAIADGCAWDTFVPQTYTDQREVLSVLTTIAEQARFFLLLGYEIETVRATLRNNFPGEDPEPYIVAAIQHKDAVAAELDTAQSRLDRAAVEAELDVNQSMHD